MRQQAISVQYPYADFQSFVTKLPEEIVKKIKFDGFDSFRQVIHTANLSLKMEEPLAYGILSALLSTISARETLFVTCDYFDVLILLRVVIVRLRFR